MPPAPPMFPVNADPENAWFMLQVMIVQRPSVRGTCGRLDFQKPYEFNVSSFMDATEVLHRIRNAMDTIRTEAKAAAQAAALGDYQAAAAETDATPDVARHDTAAAATCCFHGAAPCPKYTDNNLDQAAAGEHAELLDRARRVLLDLGDVAPRLAGLIGARS